MGVRYHESDLRKFRISEPGSVYAVTKNVLDRRSVLIPDPYLPRESDPAKVVRNSIRWHHERGVIDCWAYAVMPDHFHLVFKLGEDWSLQKTMKVLCQFTAKEINQSLGQTGRFWQKGFYDRRVRSEEELYNQLNYVEQNPVKVGFCQSEGDWPWSAVYPQW